MMGAVATEPPKFPGEGYALDTSLTEPGICGSVFISDQQMKSRTEALSACTSENSSNISSNNETQEKRCEKLLSTLPASSVESTHRGLDGEILSQLQEDGQKPNVTENHSNSCQSRRDMEHTEADTSCSSSDPGDSVHLIEISTTATLRDNRAGIEGDNSESHLDFTEAPSALKHEDQVTMSKGDADPTLKVVSAELNKPCVDAFLHCPLVTNTWDSLDSNETVASPKANEAILRENVFDQASEPLGPDTRRGTSHSLSFANFPEHKLPTQETSTTVVVTTALDRWQRFDAEESEASGTLSMSSRLEGFNQSVDGAPQKRLELWEQLLEDGLEVSTQCLPVSTAPVEAEVGIDSSLFDGNQYWLASPGNPFIEGLERSSNFSEADCFVTNVNLVRSHSLHDYEVDAFPSSKDRLIQGDNIGKQKIPGITYDNYKLAEQNVGSQLNGSCSDGSKRIAKQRFPSFSDIRRSSSRPQDPSSVSSNEQEQIHQASNIVHIDEGGGEKWEANFDLMVHESPRSLSLPREAGDSHRQASFSVYSGEAPVTSQSKLSGFLSPKLSPIVKKVVGRVRTAPDQVMNVVRQGKGSQDEEKKGSKTWMWRCCTCFSRGN